MTEKDWQDLAKAYNLPNGSSREAIANAQFSEFRRLEEIGRHQRREQQTTQKN